MVVSGNGSRKEGRIATLDIIVANAGYKDTNDIVGDNAPLEESTSSYRIVSRFYGRRVSVVNSENPEQHLVGVLQQDVGMLSCKLTYFENDKVRVKYFDPAELQLEEQAEGYVFLRAAREIPQQPFETGYVTGAKALAARVTLLRKRVFGATTVYNTL